MDKEEALNDFLKGLRIVLNNALAYSKDHPYLIKSVENFKQKIDALFTFLSPIKIDIAVDSLFIDGRKFEKVVLYVELAQIFHQRKIKSIELRQGLMIEELIDFINGVSLPTKEILRQKGLKNILNREKSPHVVVDDLDYSQLLGAEGEEVKDVWVYLFKEALEKKDSQRINAFADNFERIMGKIKMKDLLEDDELKKNLNDFLSYLKENQGEKFYKCSKEIFKATSKNKAVFEEADIDKIKAFFKNFNAHDFANLLWDEITTDEGFDTLSFELFSRLTGEESHKEVASSFLEKAVNKESFQKNPKAIKKTQHLLSAPREQSTSEVYRNTLTALLKDISFGQESFFDRDLLHRNYLFILLNLLGDERNIERLRLISERLSRELEGVTKDRDYEYLKGLSDILNKRKKEEPLLKDTFDGLDRGIAKFVEGIIWEENPPVGLEYFVDTLERTSLNADFYLDKIFREDEVNPYGLQLFFRFFSKATPLFYKNLESRYYDLEFLEKIMKSLAKLNPSLSKEILKHIFYFANEIIKREVLKAMQGLAEFDEEFLFSVLQRGEVSLKREALAILVRDENLRERALKGLLSIRSPWGKENKVIMENIMVIEDLGLKEAGDYLVSLSKRHFFWNRNIRKKASEVLKKWNVRKD